MLVLAVSFNENSPRYSHSRHVDVLGTKNSHIRGERVDAYPETQPYYELHLTPVAIPTTLNDESPGEETGADHGGLELKLLRNVPPELFHRNIRDNDEDLFHTEQDAYMTEMDENDPHDLHNRWDIKDRDNGDFYLPSEDFDYAGANCTRPPWTYDIHPICNDVHQLVYDRPFRNDTDVAQPYDINHLGMGYNRDVHLFSAQHEDVVVKNFRYERPLDRHDVASMEVEALMMEKLTASPFVSNIYSFCGLVAVVEKGRQLKNEVMPYAGGRVSQWEVDELQKDDVHPYNAFTNEQKLDLAISMAESLAEFHGFSGSVVVNDDISFDQWLYADSDDGRIMLNDLNNVLLLTWNREKQEYCKFYRQSEVLGFSAPETYRGDWVDESSDVWPMGNVIFSLLTGLYPYNDYTDQAEVTQQVLKGPPYIDPRYRTRSFIEGRMVEIMDKCHQMNPQDRVSIFDVVQFLRETRDMHQKQQQTEAQLEMNTKPKD